MNGIIHNCFHPEETPKPNDELAVFEAVATFIDRVFALVRPRRLLYLAVDGVAPRAKMNQQRSRRFRAAKEAALKAQAQDDRIAETKHANGKHSEQRNKSKSNQKDPKSITPSSDSSTTSSILDSNVITPGTPFMHRLMEFLQQYLISRVNLNPAWKDVKIFLSDCYEPGEGEHKIMAFVRHQRIQPGYDPNTKHVLFGLDADLIMLGLATHESYFWVLREFVSDRPRCTNCHAQSHTASLCTAKQQSERPNLDDNRIVAYVNPCQMLSISVLREYITQEFRDCRPRGSDFDLDRVVDDYVLMCFFVGNDFLPHLPSLDIRQGGIDHLIRAYKKAFSRSNDYLTVDGTMNLESIRYMLEALSTEEDFILKKKARDSSAGGYSYSRAQSETHGDGSGGGGGGGRVDQDAERRPRKRPLEEAAADDATPEDRAPSATGSANQAAAKRLRAQFQKPTPTDSSHDARADGVSFTANGAVVPHTASGAPAPLAQPTPFLSATTLPRVDSSSSIRPEDTQEDSRGSSSSTTTTPSKQVVDEVRLGEPGYQDRYYNVKFKWSPAERPSQIQSLVRSYLQGMQWVLSYYYRGCASWSWYYPYHYAPFALDLANTQDLSKFSFTEDRPFDPFEQLMAVLPASSGAITLPKVYSELMASPDSPLADMYPLDFKEDPNGESQPWKAVILLPFVDEQRLFQVLSEIPKSQFTEDEVQRNGKHPCRVFCHTKCNLSSNYDTTTSKLGSASVALTAAQTSSCAGRFQDDPSTSQELLLTNSKFSFLGAPIVEKSNQCRIFIYSLPIVSVPFSYHPLPGVTPPPKHLRDGDRPYDRPSGPPSRSSSSAGLLPAPTTGGPGANYPPTPHPAQSFPPPYANGAVPYPAYYYPFANPAFAHGFYGGPAPTQAAASTPTAAPSPIPGVPVPVPGYPAGQPYQYQGVPYPVPMQPQYYQGMPPGYYPPQQTLPQQFVPPPYPQQQQFQPQQFSPPQQFSGSDKAYRPPSSKRHR